VQVIAAGQSDGTLVLYDVEDGEPLQRRQVHVHPISAAAWLEVVQPAGACAECPPRYGPSLEHDAS